MTTAFQEMLSQDIKDIFLNPEEFGETHLVDGKEMVVILDDNELVERNDKVFQSTLPLREVTAIIHKKTLITIYLFIHIHFNSPKTQCYRFHRHCFLLII